jgi:hypothetical protein
MEPQINQNQNIAENLPPTIPTNNSEHKKVGPIIATMVIVLVLIVAALYVFASQVNKQTMPIIDNSMVNNSPVSSQPAIQSTVQTIQNNADDIQSLQNDLNKSTDGIDSQNF